MTGAPIRAREATTLQVPPRRIGIALALFTLLVLGGPASGLSTSWLDAADAPPAAAAAPARQLFEDVTQAIGLGDYLHAGFLGDTRQPKFIEAMGAGACWLDADGDDKLDLFLVNGRYHTEAEKEAALAPTSRLYRNTGAGFVDATSAAGLALRAWGQGCAAADYDNDGRTDLYVTAYGSNFLFRNAGGGAFVDVTTTLGVDGGTCGAYPCWSASATWFDHDLDGCLDLYVTNFADWNFTTPGTNGPENVVAQPNVFYRGSCGGAFVDATDASGLRYLAHTWSSVAHDLNGDGWPDLYDSNDRDPNALWLNNGNGTFRRHASAASDPRAGMGTAIGDLNHDGRPDIVTTNFVQETNGVFLARADGGYTDVGGTLPFRDSRPWSGWATRIFDHDHDARADLMVVNSMTENLSAYVPDLPTAHPLLLYRQGANGTFAQTNATLGAAFERGYYGRGAAWGDYDDDGDVDVLLVQAGEAPVHLLRADRAPGNFLVLDLVGTRAGVTRDAIGSRVTVQADGIPLQVQQKAPQMGFMSTNDPRLHFGLGDATRANLTVRWPDGSTQWFANVTANAFLRLEQDAPAPAVVQQRPIAWAEGVTPVERLAPAAFRAGLDAPIVRADWDFGDGATAACEAGRCVDANGTEIGTLSTHDVSLAHAFATVGPYDVHVALTDAEGRVTAKRLSGDVTAPLHASLRFDRRAFGITAHPTGVARVTYTDGAPVAGASVDIAVTYSFWRAPEDMLLPALPRAVRELAGYRTEIVTGTTDANGTMRFEVPLWWRSPVPAAPVAFNPVGDYTATMTGTFRHSTFGPANASYQILATR